MVGKPESALIALAVLAGSWLPSSRKRLQIVHGHGDKETRARRKQQRQAKRRNRR